MKCKHLPGIEVTYCALCDIGPYKGQYETTPCVVKEPRCPKCGNWWANCPGHPEKVIRS